MKNIAFVFPAGCYAIPAINGGAVESLLTALITENEDYGKYQFHIIMCKNNDDKTNYDYSNFKYTKFYDFYQSGVRFKIDRLVNALNKRTTYSLPIYSKYEKYILNTLTDINPDFIVFEGSFNASVRRLAKIFDKDKLIYHVHHQVFPKINVSKFFGRMFCVSQFIKKDWQEIGLLDKSFKYQILNNCITTPNFTEKISDSELNDLRKSLNIQDDDFVIIYCGRLIKDKGIEVLVRAVNSLNNEKVKLIVVGESAYKNSIETDFVKNLKALAKDNKNIIFTGFIHNSELNKYYRIANLQVIPTLIEEAAGIVALEGKALGIPQIITNSGGLQEYANKNAIVVDKSQDLEKQLNDEINNFISGKYQQLEKDESDIWDTKFYYNQFTDIINE